ncbi:phosphate acyltransferase PlsX [Lacticaseibacillus saniviri]|uniref:Phosphate acyltransferase n=1 Tax=Lacticaseibacillus saniviri JCM 17471 = DSM 24301 TaxID=1293598 RepID=A0A0R2MYJ6_9LACO|nr:phosphate acyltransferase PlsX [Lacticaseibacillus saniviri]KRO18597.1 Fatty acid phospholipid biosynthesis enzyme [Lacticaseibacillus saniviri JCM 17471 = DSM 24301]MCG4283012.1 phosphate acyltransferase PlsX [Lacticaseibacillus saniviri]
MKIAVDAMGGDNAPEVVIAGVEQARDAFNDVEFLLYGDENKIKPLIKDDTRLTLIHTTEKVESTDEPVKAIRGKKQASMVLAAQAVKNKEADAVLSLGSTGALLAAGLFIVGRIRGIDRPGLMPTLPTTDDKGFLMLDVGANAENRAQQLLQYAIMGNFYAQDLRDIKQPRIGLLNNGTEPNKGDKLHQETFALLDADKDLNFVGNVEASSLLSGVADVVVTDGFTGNATLKATEGAARTILSLLKHTIMDNGVKAKLGGALLKSDLKGLATKFDVSRYGGAALIGLKAPVVKAHGAADAKAVYYAINQIRDMVTNQTIQKVVDYFEAHPEMVTKTTKEA